MHRDTSHLTCTRGDPAVRDGTGDRARTAVLGDVDDAERLQADRGRGRRPLEIIAAGRPLPDVLHALCRYLETAAADWERREAELKRSEAFLAQAQQLTKTASVWWRPSTGEIAWSAENYRLLEYPPTVTPTVELALDRCHPDDLSLVSERLAAVVRDGASSAFEHRLLMPGGAVKHVRVVFQNVGRPGAPEFIGAATDITEWKAAEERLRRSEAYLAEAQRLSATGNFGWKLADGAHCWSDETFRIFGYDRSTPITLASILSRVHPEDQDLVRQLIAGGEAGRDLDQEFRLLLPDGAVRHVHVVAHGVRGHDGRLEIVGAIQDVTERRRSEEVLGTLQSDLAHFARVASIGVLTASIAHEVNQPLSGAVTNASTCLRMLSRETPSVDQARDAARRAIRDAIRASEVITRVRALFAGRPQVAEPVDLNEATREVVALSRRELQRGRAVLRLELADDLPLVLADRVQLQQVLLNLLRNACEAMRDVDDRRREVVIRTARVDDGAVRVEVRDSGVGLAPHVGGRLFDAFHTTKPDGMGIGLSVSRSIIESHRGRLWAAPNDGPGATFGFSLPGRTEPGVDATR